jgi:hypothetical protein
MKQDPLIRRYLVFLKDHLFAIDAVFLTLKEEGGEVDLVSTCDTPCHLNRVNDGTSSKFGSSTAS